MNEVLVGKLGAAYGIRGWLKLHSFTDDPEAIFSYAPWLLKQGKESKPVKVAQWKRHNKGLIVLLEGMTNRNDAEPFIGCEIAVDETQMPELPQGDYYWRDLIGMAVVTDKGYHLGEVKNLMETGSNDVLEVKANSKDAFGQSERLIPFIEAQVILQVDLDNRQITVDWDPSF